MAKVINNLFVLVSFMDSAILFRLVFLGLIIAVIVFEVAGVILFKEDLSFVNKIGISLGIISLVLIEI